jgi:ATP-dependent DNA helicase DinG
MTRFSKSSVDNNYLRKYTDKEIKGLFSPDGPIAKYLEAFEERPQQAQMAVAVQQCFTTRQHLVAEAGTGVGKSFGYLIPAIIQACQGAGKILISTFTITLQEQLINKDIPFLADCTTGILGNFTAVLAKGRGNYICRRRLEFAIRRQKGLFDETGYLLADIKNWAKSTTDGSLSDIPYTPKGTVWDAVKSEHGNCRGRKCPHFRNCFYFKARRETENADIIVANHALMFSDLVLKEQGTSLLPDYRFVIIDEAHNIEHVAEEHFGINISNRQIMFLLNSLYNTRTHRGILTYMSENKNINQTIEAVIKANKVCSKFFKEIRQWKMLEKDQNQGRCEKDFVRDILSEQLSKLRTELIKLSGNSKDADEKFEFTRYADRCTDLVHQLKCHLNQTLDDHIYWVETNHATSKNITLKSAAINVGQDVKRTLFDQFESVVLTSATLSCSNADRQNGFDFFTSQIGLEDFRAVKLGSPFDYKNQVTIYIEKELPNPNNCDFTEKAAETLKKYIMKTQGRAFVLFTSYAMMNEMSGQITDWLSQNSIELLQQGTGIDRSVLLRYFKTNQRCVLFGTDSFWQGIDVPGQSLCNVIIVRLPFAVPDKPLMAGRLKEIKDSGGNPFYDYQLPSAIIKFKQGFGRLIRTKTDSGIIVILDSRVINKVYGASFLNAIPECKINIIENTKNSTYQRQCDMNFKNPIC